jgi:hypothetical protein
LFLRLVPIRQQLRAVSRSTAASLFATCPTDRYSSFFEE